MVHAVKGERAHYQPIKSILCSGPDPLETARCLHDETRCRELYIADLDAIQGMGHNREAIAKIASQLDVDLWVDAGTADNESAGRILSDGADRVIIGSETLAHVKQLGRICGAVPQEKLIFSIDTARGRVLSRAQSLGGLDPVKALERLTREGLTRFILLTLDMVGAGTGPDLPLLRRARKGFPGHTLIAGGGVKTPDHLHALSEAGINGVLIATSLHRGWITERDISNLPGCVSSS